MRTAVLVPFFSGFYQQQEYGLCDYLARHGEDVTLITSSLRMKKFSRHGAAQTELPFKTLVLPALPDVAGLPIIPALGEVLREGHYDIVHAHEDFQPQTIHAFFACRREGIPFLYSTEIYYVPPFPKSLPFRVVNGTISRFLRTHCPIITAHSNDSRDFLVRNGAPPARVVVIPAGVDAERFHPFQSQLLREKVGFDRSVVLVLTVARLVRYKGLEYLLQALSVASERCRDLRLVILGSGPLEEELQNLVRSLGLVEKVFILNEPISNADMPKVYNSADIFVLPSIVEPFGVAVLEAMACGLPVIGSRVGGMKDTIRHQETGVQVEPGDVPGWVSSLELLARDPRMRRDLGSAALNAVRRVYAWPCIVEKYIEIYGDLVAGES